MDGIKEKASQVGITARDQTVQAKDQAGGYIEVAKEKTSEAAQVTKDKACEAAQVTKDKTTQLVESGKESAVAGKEQTGGFLQKTGEQVMGMAVGATDAVKNTLGMGGEKK